MRSISLNIKERGQILPIVVVGLVVIIIMAALILDGGFLMVNRRAAQNAADAGALAGAREMCLHHDPSVVISTAIDYAVAQNNATTAQAVIQGGEVVVNTQIDQGSFFARIFDQSTLVTTATAAAGCFPPAEGNYVMPIAWSCRAPAGGSDSEDCEVETLDWETEFNPLLTGDPTSVVIDGVTYNYEPNFFDDNILPQIYIVMDAVSTSTEVLCLEDGGPVNCDINGDGRNDIEGEGNRSWLDLDGGGGGASEMVGWIEDGLDRELDIHTWLSSEPGNMTNGYKAMKSRLNEVVIIIIFNQYCDDNPADKPECITAAHTSFPIEPGNEDLIIDGSSNTYFHTVGFGAFYVTCVHEKNSDKCPGYDLAESVNPSIKNNVNSVEGYFISGYPFPTDDVGTGGVDLGNYITSLTR